MIRRKWVSQQERMNMLLKGTAGHPWARSDFLQAVSGLWPGAFDATVRLGLEARLLETGDVPVARRAPQRLALTSAGAAEAGWAWSRAAQAEAWLQALKLDVARRLMQSWLAEHSLVWSLSPFTLPAGALRPAPRPGWAQDEPAWRALAYRSLRLDALACVQLDQGVFLNAAVIVDPGGIGADWLAEQFRSAHAWGRREEFRGHEYAMPLFVLVAADATRLQVLIRLWQEAVRAGDTPSPLRATTLVEIADPTWHNEQGSRTSLWGGTVPFKQPSERPTGPVAHWWGALASDAGSADAPLFTHSRLVVNQALLTWASRPNVPQARLVRLHGQLSLHARELLDRVGQYPLLGSTNMAAVMGCTQRHVRSGLAELREAGLTQPMTGGYVITWRGLSLLAAQAGIEPATYGRLRGWPIRHEDNDLVYSVKALRAALEHTRLLMDFLVGLRKYGPDAGLRLKHWQHMHFARPFITHSKFPADDIDTIRWVMPDATGTVQLLDHDQVLRGELDFWLEVDRGTVQGSALGAKLQRYCDALATWPGLSQRGPRLLLLMEHRDEARLQNVRRRMLGLRHTLGARLDVRLTRADLLSAGRAGLNPTLHAWRNLYSNDFVRAFDL